jgi:Double zinc ribbon
MGTIAIFGITSDALNTVVMLILLCLVAIWIALVYWTYADAHRRIADPMLVGCATAASLFPFFGTIVYMIVRPPEYLDDVRERELEILAAEARLSQAEIQHCPYCDFEIERSFLRCPSCLRKLKEPCLTCGKPLDPRWKICPYCEAEIGQPPPRRRAAPAASRPAAAPRAAAAGGGGTAAVTRPQAAPPPQGETPTRTRPPAR